MGEKPKSDRPKWWAYSNLPARELIIRQENRIAELEAHLQQLSSGTSLPFPAVTDRHLIDKAREDGKRIAELQAIIEAAPHHLTCKYWKSAGDYCDCWKSKAMKDQPL